MMIKRNSYRLVKDYEKRNNSLSLIITPEGPEKRIETSKKAGQDTLKQAKKANSLQYKDLQNSGSSGSKQTEPPNSL